MKVVKVIKEFTNDDVRTYRKSRKRVPSWLFGREEGTQLRVTDADFQDNRAYLEELEVAAPSSPKRRGRIVST